MTNPMDRQVGLALVAPDPRLNVDYEYPYCWLDRVRRATYGVSQLVRDQVVATVVDPQQDTTGAFYWLWQYWREL